MGAKTWMIVYADANAALKPGLPLDRDATLRLATTLFPGEKLEPLEDGNLSRTFPPRREVCIGCFPGVSVVAAKELGGDRPSRVPARFLEAGVAGTTTVVAIHSVVDWFAYAQWQKGTLIRSLSVSPDTGVIEDIGPRMGFEEPYWSGQHPAVDDDQDDYPLPFHPLDLGEAALAELLGYQLEGLPNPALFDPNTIPLARYKRSR